MKRLPAAALCVALTGCARYADFTLPPLAAPGRVPRVSWSVQKEPVIARGAPGEFDAIDALNPSVVERDGMLWNFYSGYDGKTWRTGAATSPDGIEWRKRGRVLSPLEGSWEGGYIAANGSALYEGNEFLYWYQAGRPPRIGLARSRDGRRWSKHPEPVLPLGPRGSWDERAAADPYVVRIGDWLYMYYLGEDRARRQRLGVARSKDGGRWEKLRANPVMELGGLNAFDEAGLGEPAVWQSRGSYWMLYTGRDRREVRRTGLARSSDGVRWEKVEGSALAGGSAWNSKVVCDPSVIPAIEGVRVWFGGGDAARPDENLNGQIGYALLRIE